VSEEGEVASSQREEPDVGDADQDGQGSGTGSGGDGIFQPRDDGQLHFLPGTENSAFPVTAPENATPLEDGEPEGTVPPSPLWAMKDRRHEQLPHLFGHPHRIRASIGTGDDAVYAIDDGKHHCMLGRRVGATRDGCVYSLVTRVPIDVYQSLAAGSISPRDAFLAGSDAGLSGTVDEPGLSNVFDVDFYQHPTDIPDRYLPPAPFVDFTEDLPTADR
jgi:hypothetical protein